MFSVGKEFEENKHNQDMTFLMKIHSFNVSLMATLTVSNDVANHL